MCVPVPFESSFRVEGHVTGGAGHVLLTSVSQDVAIEVGLGTEFGTHGTLDTVSLFGFQMDVHVVFERLSRVEGHVTLGAGFPLLARVPPNVFAQVGLGKEFGADGTLGFGQVTHSEPGQRSERIRRKIRKGQFLV